MDGFGFLALGAVVAVGFERFAEIGEQVAREATGVFGKCDDAVEAFDVLLFSSGKRVNQGLCECGDIGVS